MPVHVGYRQIYYSSLVTFSLGIAVATFTFIALAIISLPSSL